MVASLNAESRQASKKHTVPTHSIGIIDIEKQVLILLECKAQWKKRDISEHQQLELQHLSKQEGMDTGSGE